MTSITVIQVVVPNRPVADGVMSAATTMPTPTAPIDAPSPRMPPLTFPCDEHGQVDLDELCDRSRRDYLFAHTLIGRNFTSPVIRACLV